jgi:hypothetical protein
MMTNIRIRPARSGDWAQLEILVAGICQFHGDTHGLTRSQFDNFAIGDHAPVTVLVAESEDGILAGFVAGFAIYRAKRISKCRIYSWPRISGVNASAKS